ncbi:MAG: NADH-quinone oxidoreductase subunit H, partial [Chloroflexi bacterium]|nr:NADH-quinone oxidoreductase subunit H [Chloroflexota bacterium]
WFVIKLSGFIFFFTWMRATLPRLRFDQLMRLGWKVLLPLAALNLVVIAGLVAAMGG